MLMETGKKISNFKILKGKNHKFIDILPIFDCR